MKTGNFTAFATLSVLLSLTAAACSKDASVIAVFGESPNVHRITVADVKPFFIRYCGNPTFITNDDLQRGLIFQYFMMRDIVYLEQIKNGYTNTEKFKDSFLKDYKKYEFNMLASKGLDAIKKSEKTNEGEKFDIVHPAHILLMVNRSTNIERINVDYIKTNGIRKPVTNRITIQTNLSDKEFAALLKAKENSAFQIIDSLKKSGNIEKEFGKTASNISEDTVSARNNGDDGWIPKSYMSKEFDDAAFSAKDKGLMDKPVYSPSGYYIIFIKELASQKSIPAIEREIGKANFHKFENLLGDEYYERIKNENIKDNYTVDMTNKTVTIEGKTYKTPDIPDSAVMVVMWGKPLTWKDCKDEFALVQASIDQKMPAEEFSSIMNFIKNTLFNYDYAIKVGLDKDTQIINTIAKMRENFTKYIAYQDYVKDRIAEMNEKISNADTPQAEKEYYNNHKGEFMKIVRNKTVQMSFKEVSGNIKELIKNQISQQYFNDWKDAIMKKMKVSYLASGWRDLKAIEMDQFKKLTRNAKGPGKK